MCRGYFSSQEIDAHHATEHRSTDQSRNGCGMCCFCHAQPFEITRAEKIKSTLLQHSRQNAKVVEAFCHAACRLSNQCRPSIHQPPVDEFRMPAEMSMALSRAHLHARMHVASCWRRVHHRDRHQHTIPIALAALPGTSRDFVPWRFSDAGRRSAWIASSCRHPKTYTAAAVRAKSAFATLSRHRLRHLVIAPISTIKILTVAPELCSRRVGAIEAISDLEE